MTQDKEVVGVNRISTHDAKHTLLWTGHLVPVTKMYDVDGRETDNPLHALSCVIYVGEMGEKPYIPASVHPGEIAPKMDYAHATISHKHR